MVEEQNDKLDNLILHSSILLNILHENDVPIYYIIYTHGVSINLLEFILIILAIYLLSNAASVG